MKGLEEAKELAKADLPEPALLRHFIYSKTDYTTRRTMKISRFVSTIEMWNGKLIQRVFGFVASTTQRRMWDMEVREVARYLEGFNHCLLRDVWHDMYKHCVEYDRQYQKDEFWICDGKPWNFYGYIMYDESKMIELLNIPYCQYHSENNQSYLSFFQYICLYRKEPKIELLVKAGLSQYLSGLRYLDLKQKSLDKIFKVDKKFVPMLKDMSTSLLLVARKHSWVDSLEDLREIYYLKRDCKYIYKYMSKRTLEYCIEKVKYQYWLYNDYLSMAEQMGLDMKNNKVLYPTDIRKAHDKAAKEIQIFKDKQVDEKIKAVSEQMNKYSFNNEIYDIFPASCTEDLIAESEALGHCVRTYAKRVANGETTIFFVRKHDQRDVPLYTLEFRGKKVIQFRGNHNCAPDDQAKQFVHLWMKDIVKNPDGYLLN